jgi:hypothetical protein
MYKLKNDSLNKEVVAGVFRLSDNAFIPFAIDNTDYQEYLKWVAEGGVPLPADE